MFYIDCFRELFNRIAAEDMEFAHDEDSDFEIPEFGTSTSDYNEVNFHIFYCTWTFMMMMHFPFLFTGGATVLRLLAIVLYAPSLLLGRQVQFGHLERSSSSSAAPHGKGQQETEGRCSQGKEWGD